MSDIPSKHKPKLNIKAASFKPKSHKTQHTAPDPISKPVTTDKPVEKPSIAPSIPIQSVPSFPANINQTCPNPLLGMMPFNCILKYV